MRSTSASLQYIYRGKLMRIGVIEGKSDKTSGGAWTFTTSLVTVLKTGNTKNQFLLLDDFLEEEPQPAVSPEALSDAQKSFFSPIRSATRFARRWPPVDRLFMQLVPPVHRFARQLIGAITEYRTRKEEPSASLAEQDPSEIITKQLNALIQRFQIDVVWFMSPACGGPANPGVPVRSIHCNSVGP